MDVHTMITERGAPARNAPVNLVVKLPVWLREQARAAAKQRGETVSEVVQMALAEYLMADGEEAAAAQDRAPGSTMASSTWWGWARRAS